MTFVYEEPLLDYMRQKGMSSIAIEVISSNSDFEVTELHVHLIRDSQAEYFKKSKGFRGILTEHGEVLLPSYRLEYSDTITFGLKKFWIFHSIKYSGIKL